MRILPINVIAQEWYRERTVGLPQKVIEAELQRAHVNLAPGRNWRTEGFVPVGDVDDLTSLPAPETDVTKDWLEEFAIKQGWPLPRFWFPDQAPPVRPRGRPSNKEDILAELRLRAERDELAGRVSEQAKQLSEWMSEKGLGMIQVKSIEKIIRVEYRQLRRSGEE
ncbi:hypothetical protein [Pseudophaeobacter sp. C1-32P7]|uniref:hypothetical protein n=1 Tax=Pseudophaeobacter sp. C1-32P7 TaxID=3098142 RepID=UPI0034D76F7A